MPRTFAEVKADVLKNIGGRSDTDSIAIVERAINTAIEIVAITFDVPEMHTYFGVTVGAPDNSFFLDSTWRLIDIKKIRNETQDFDMFPLPFELLDILVPANIGNTKYYSRHGDQIHFRRAAWTTLSFLIYGTQYPAQITDPATELPFQGHDGQVIAVATVLAWAAFEETESSNLWAQVAQALGVSYAAVRKAREFLTGTPQEVEVTSANNTGGAKAAGIA